MAGQDAADGRPFGRYRLVELLGRGGMGEVWRAYDTETKRSVAIKVLPPHLADDGEFVQRFRREAEAAAQLNSPHVIPIHHYGEIDGRLYVDMRLIVGRDLGTVLAEGPLEPARAVRIIEQVAKALHAAHQAGLLHRDIKPANILLDRDDFAYLIDFGIARGLDETRMTKSGNTIGTLTYIAPERLDPRIEEDARADIYSLACVLYEALTGEPPFSGTTTAHLIAAHLNMSPPRPSAIQPNVPTQFDAVIATGMAKNPGNRYATTVELADAARDAITVRIQRPAPAPALLPTTQQARNRVPAQPMAFKAESPAPARLARPPQPAAPVPTKVGGVSRRTTIALIAGLIAIVAVIAAAVGISALGKHGPSASSPTSSSLPVSSERSQPMQIVLPFSGLNNPEGVAVDGKGTIYLTDAKNNRVLALAAGASAQTVLPFSGLNSPTGVAVDGQGTVYVADYFNDRVLALAVGASAQTVLPFTGLKGPASVAVNSQRTVYVADWWNGQVVALAAGSTVQTVLPFTRLYRPCVAVDGQGTVYVADDRNQVLALAAGASAHTVLHFDSLDHPDGVAVDSTGTVYVSDRSNNRVVKLAAGSSAQSVLPLTGLNNPVGVSVDSSGNLYVADSTNNRVLKLPVR